MPSTWLTRRTVADGSARFRVEYRVGGRESPTRYGGSFRTKRDALARKAWITGELAAQRVPDLKVLAAETLAAILADVATRWKTSRVDVSAGTMKTYEVALGRLIPRLGTRALDSIDAPAVAELVAELHHAGLKKQTIRKTVSVLRHDSRSRSHPAEPCPR